MTPHEAIVVLVFCSIALTAAVVVVAAAVVRLVVAILRRDKVVPPPSANGRPERWSDDYDSDPTPFRINEPSPTEPR